MKEKLEKHYTEILQILGEDISREGLQKTPHRVAKSLLFLTQGYQQNAIEILQSATFQAPSNNIVIVKKIEFYSLCEHHLLPFFGHVNIAYKPNKIVTGLSKLGRVVDVFAQRLQLQERITMQIANAVNDALNPLGVAVNIEAQHMCMQMRGVQKHGSITSTNHFIGCFEQSQFQHEFLQLIK